MNVILVDAVNVPGIEKSVSDLQLFAQDIVSILDQHRLPINVIVYDAHASKYYETSKSDGPFHLSNDETASWTDGDLNSCMLKVLNYPQSHVILCYAGEDDAFCTNEVNLLGILNSTMSFLGPNSYSVLNLVNIRGTLERYENLQPSLLYAKDNSQNHLHIISANSLSRHLKTFYCATLSLKLLVISNIPMRKVVGDSLNQSYEVSLVTRKEVSYTSGNFQWKGTRDLSTSAIDGPLFPVMVLEPSTRPAQSLVKYLLSKKIVGLMEKDDTKTDQLPNYVLQLDTNDNHIPKLSLGKLLYESISQEKIEPTPSNNEDDTVPKSQMWKGYLADMVDNDMNEKKQEYTSSSIMDSSLEKLVEGSITAGYWKRRNL